MLLLTACDADGAQPTPPPSTPSYEATSSQPLPATLTANGILHPARRLALSFRTSGTVETLDVDVGMTVQAGQTLATLDDADLQRAVTLAALDVEDAQAQLLQLQAQAVPIQERVIAATAAISNAQSMLAQAQAQYDVRGNQAILDRAALTDAEQALNDAQNGYNHMLDDPITKDWAPYSPAAKALEDMQDYYQRTLAQYRLHSADRGYEVAIANAEAQLAQAQSALYDAEHPVRPETLALAELSVKRAQQALAAAQEDLRHATLSAPFDGVIAVRHTSVGEWAAPGTPVVELLDISRWHIETNNVGELQIAQVREGQKATVRINAFQSQALAGRVATISPVAVVQQGDTTYTLTIDLDDPVGDDGLRLNLRPGMTVRVEIELD